MSRLLVMFFAPLLAMTAIFGGIAIKPPVKVPTAKVTRVAPAAKPVVVKDVAVNATSRLTRVSAFSTTRLGWVGDAVAKRHWQQKGWNQLQSKYHGEKGIDTIMIQKRNGVTRVALIENKVNGATLSKGQMSEAWLRQKVAEMKSSGTKKIADHARIVEQALNGSEGYKAYRILARHNLKEGTTTYFKLGADGKPVRQLAITETGSLMDGAIAEIAG